jgi:hypothetical protein
MGYKPKRTLYKLDFSETEYAGLEVTTRSVSVKGLLAIAAAADEVDEVSPAEDKVMDLLGRFARVIVSWNVEDDDGQPLQPTVEVLLDQDFAFVMAIINAWIVAVSQAPPPLPGTSNSGATSPEASIPGLAEASSALPSSPAPG